MPIDPQDRIRIVVCEDDEDLRDILLEGLPHFGFEVFGVPSAEALERFLAAREADVLLLDIGLPGEDGFSAARRLRTSHPGLGIIMLTARGVVEDRIRGLSLGADLYFVKPVDLRELAAGIASLQRRLAAGGPAAEDAPWQLEPLASRLRTPAGRLVRLAAGELKALARLMEAPGTVVSREALLEVLGWSPASASGHRLEALLSRLRSKVQASDPSVPLPLEARRGSGYAFFGRAFTRG